MNIALLILGLIFLIYVSVQIERKKEAEEYHDTEFDLSTVNEKLIRADQTRIDLNSMESLLTDLSVASPEMQIVLRLTWLDLDGEQHTYDLYCDGINTASESMRSVSEREVFELREALAYQCAELNYITAINKEKQDGVRKNIIKQVGEWLFD